MIDNINVLIVSDDIMPIALSRALAENGMVIRRVKGRTGVKDGIGVLVPMNYTQEEMNRMLRETAGLRENKGVVGQVIEMKR